MKVMEYKGVQYVRSHMHTLTAAHDLFELSPEQSCCVQGLFCPAEMWKRW